jgi:carbamoyltransferase
MTIWGINALNHGSSLAVFDNNQLISNEYSHSDTLSYDIISRGLKHGFIEKIYWYEQPWLKKLRQLRAGQWSRAFDWSVLPRRFVDKQGFPQVPIVYTPHHASHAAAGYYTSPFDRCAVVVLDAIGEFDCASIWLGENDRLTRLWSRSYPDSLGLFYSAFTQTLGLTPISEEGTLQRYAEQGDPARYYDRVNRYFNGTVKLNYNFHCGVNDQDFDLNSANNKCDLAAAVQMVFEQQVDQVMSMAQRITGSDNLVYMGGCAMNSQYNRRLQQRWQGVWSLPQPGDPSSSIGAVLYHTQKRVTDYDFGVVKHLEISV